MSSWRDSLSLLKPGTFKLLALATLNAWIKAWKVGWPYVVPAAFIPLLLWQLLRVPLMAFPYIPLSCSIAAIALFLAAARPSLERKDTHYFLRIIRDHLLIIVLGALPFVSFVTLLMDLPAFFILVLFILDSKPWSVRSYLWSIRNAFFLTLYNFPFLFLMTLAQYVIFFAIILGMMFIYPALLLGTAVAFVISTLFMSFWTVIYTKRVHDQNGLYT